MFRKKEKPKPSFSEQLESAIAHALREGTDARWIADVLESRVDSLRAYWSRTAPWAGAAPKIFRATRHGIEP